MEDDVIMENCAVIGYGSWATTLVRQITLGGRSVKWHVTNPEVREGILADSRNPKYVRDALLDTSLITLCEDINDAVRGCRYVILGCPSAYLKHALEPLVEPLEGKFIISAIKGIVPDECTTVLEYVHDRYGIPFHELGLISGPTHAEEVSGGRTSYITAVAASEEKALEIKSIIESDNLHVNTSTDIYGIEYAGVLKNIYAIVCGVAAGLGYGDNFTAVLVSAAAAEMKHFLDVGYPAGRIATDRAYLGDLLVTCYSSYSRNRRLGLLIGRGCSVKSALNEMTMVAEGYYSTRLIQEIKSAKGIDMPLADLAYKILYKGASPRREMKALACLL